MIPYSATQGIRRLYVAAVFALLGLVSGCDRYLINICNFRDEGPGCREDVVDASAVDLTRSDSSPIGPLRKFEWRAKIGDLSKSNFVGIDKRQYAIFLVDGPPVHFEAAKFRFDLPANMPQLDAIACTGCPNLVDTNFASDSIFLTGEADREFWLLRYGATNKSFRLNMDGSLVLMDADIEPSWWIKPFFHPVLNASSIALKPLTAGKSSLVARLPRLGSTIKYVIDRPTKISTQAIGDLDFVESKKNGLDIINIGNNSIESVLHYDTEKSTSFSDDVLRSRIADAVEKTKRSDSMLLEAAYIENLNGDRYIDFIYSWSGHVHVASYTGNWTGTGSSLLEDWGKEVVIVPAGEKIRSIMALDLTTDGFPELIVETDRAVHFYLNTP
jgi:hypothetical protein